MLETSVCSQKLLWALAQLSKLCEALEEVDQQMQWVVGGTVYPEQRVNASERLYLESPTMDVFESCGEKCANLCRVYKLIMVSRVPGYGQLEYLVPGLSFESHHHVTFN